MGRPANRRSRARKYWRAGLGDADLYVASGLGFPVVVIFSWAYEMTPECLKLEKLMTWDIHNAMTWDIHNCKFQKETRTANLRRSIAAVD